MQKVFIKLGAAFGLLFLFLLIGQLLGGFIFIRYAPVPGESIGVSVLYKYWQQTGGQIWSYNTVFKVSLVVSLLIPVIMMLVLLLALFAKPKRELHGSSRFAMPVEVSKAGLLNNKYEEPDILVGRYKGKYLRFAGKQFVFLAAPTRSGKGVGIVIPNCLHYSDSLVVIDPKLENFRITAGFRAKHGQEVYLFNPSTKDLQSHGWNPLTYVSRDPIFAPGDAFNIANILYSTNSAGNDSGNSKFFNEMAQKLFVGLCLYLVETEKETGVISSMAELLKLATPEGGVSLADWIKEQSTRPDLSKECINNLLSFASVSGQTGSGILASLLAPLSVFSDPVVADITSRDDFDLRQVRKKRMTIYVGVQPNDIAKFSRLINLFFSQLISENTKELPEDNPELKYQCLLLIDEFAALGKVEIIETGVAYIAGYNVRILAIFQNMSQLKRLYTADGAKTLSSNFECQIIYPTRDNDDIKEYSEIIGYETFKSSSFSKNKMGMGQKSESISDQKRPVMLPQEIKAMPLTDCIISLTGINTIYAQKIVYYKDPVFKERIRWELPPVPDLKIKNRATNNNQAAGQLSEAEIAQIKTGKDLGLVKNPLIVIQELVKALAGDNRDPAFLMDLKQAVAQQFEEQQAAAVFQKLYNI